MSRNIKLTLAYDGGRYFGWQKTITGPSIEDTLQRVLEQVLQEKISLQAASRTDRGVHAAGQVINFISEKQQIDLIKLQKSLNQLLPSDISVLCCEHASDAFHATLDTVSKEYHYTLCLKQVQLPFDRLFSWHVPYPVDLEKMERACPHFLGTQDFSAFCNQLPLYNRGTVCTLEQLSLNPFSSGQLQIIVRGNRFLYKMVRNIIGTLVYIGCGKLPPGSLPLLFTTKQRSLGGMTAPAWGLVLKKIYYN